jgi:uncharacterized protein YxeA
MHNFLKIIYVLICIFFGFLIIRQYSTTEIKYYTDPILAEELSRPFNLNWQIILIPLSVLWIPLLVKSKIGILGLILIVAHVLQPFIQGKKHIQTAEEYYFENENEFNRLIRENKISNKSSLPLHIKNFRQEGENKFFLMHSMNGNGHGFAYSESGIFGKSVFDESLNTEHLHGKWHLFWIR